jgi:uncharacterized membrane protein YkvA (DUF1232 family)
MDKEQKDFYLKLRKKISAFLEKNNTPYADMLLLAPDLFHLLVKLTMDERVPSKEKAKFIGVIAYFISPIDLLPEFLLGPIGYLDDIALTAYVLNNYINTTDAQIVRELWAGDQDLLSSIKNILAVADKAIGSGLWKKIQGKF